MIRLWVPQDMDFHGKIPLTLPQTHYLSHVMRVPPQGSVLVFNGRQGLWEAVYRPEKKTSFLYVQKQLCGQPSPSSTVALYFSLIKRFEWILEKGTELGVTHFHPILSDRSVIRQWNEDRALRIVIEACEQSQRLSVPSIFPVQKLSSFLETGTPVFVGHMEVVEKREGEQLASHPAPPHGQVSFGAEAFLVGPEGGWTGPEIEMMSTTPHARFVCLGDHCLRSETAALAGVLYLTNLRHSRALPS